MIMSKDISLLLKKMRSWMIFYDDFYEDFNDKIHKAFNDFFPGTFLLERGCVRCDWREGGREPLLRSCWLPVLLWIQRDLIVGNISFRKFVALMLPMKMIM